MPGKAAQSVQTKSETTDSKKSVAKNSTRKNSGIEKTPAKAVAYLRVSLGKRELEKNKTDILRLANDKDLKKFNRFD